MFMFLHLDNSAQTIALAELLRYNAEHNAGSKLSVGDVEHKVALGAKGDSFAGMVLVEMSNKPHALIAPNGDTLYV